MSAWNSPASAAESFTQTMFWCSMAVVRASSSTSSSASRGRSFSRICTMSTPPAKAAFEEVGQVALLGPRVGDQVELGQPEPGVQAHQRSHGPTLMPRAR